MFSKIDVNGPGAHPIYQYLVSNEEVGTEEIGWNCEFSQSHLPSSLLG